MCMYCGHLELHKSTGYGRLELQTGKCGEQVVHSAQHWAWALSSHCTCTPLALSSKNYAHDDLPGRTTTDIRGGLLLCEVMCCSVRYPRNYLARERHAARHKQTWCMTLPDWALRSVPVK